MDDVTTKAEDVLTLKDGRLISPSVLTHPFKPLDCIEGSQIVQRAPDHVVIRIVAGPDYRPSLSDHLVHEFKARLGNDVRIEVKMVPSTGGFAQREIQVGDLGGTTWDLRPWWIHRRADVSSAAAPSGRSAALRLATGGTGVTKCVVR